jgi:hypothetical protein
MLTYRMTPDQSAVWTLGGPAAARVEEAIAEMLDAIECPAEVLVEVDNGSIAFVLERGRV